MTAQMERDRSAQVREASEKLGIVEWLRPGEHGRVEALLAAMKALKIRRLRTGVSWADWFSPGGKEWYEWLVPRLAREVELLPCLLYTPPSIGMVPKTSSPPLRPKDYADFLDLFITRFDGCFEWMELWNEPNNLSEWDWTLDPHWTKFGEMIGGAAYWARQRGKKTVLGGMSPVDPHWLCRMFELGLMEYIDAVGLHGFPDTFDYGWKGWETNISMVREVLDEHECGAELWVTEAGYSTWQHDERGQIATFLEFADAPASRLYWYGLDDLDPALAAVDRFHLDEREYCFGLKRQDGSPKLLYRLLDDSGVGGVRTFAASLPPARTSKPARRGALITGGAGFIGSNLADRLMTAGEPVTVYDNLSRPGVEKNLLWLKERHGDLLDVRVADIRNPYELGPAVAGAKRVFHFAAQVAVTTSLVGPVNDFEVNARGTLNLLEAIRAQAEPPPLVFTSTNKVYGALPDVRLRCGATSYEPDDADLRSRGIGEKRPLDFHSPYGCSKGSADQYVIDYARTYRLPMAVFRMSCIYGPRQFGTEDQGWVAHFLIRALRGEPITIYGDGKQVRDILYVDDLVSALLLASKEMKNIAGEAFNIGGGPENTLSLLELLALIRELHGETPPLRYEEWRPGDQLYYVSDTAKFRRATGWNPSRGVVEGIALLYRWLREFNGMPAPTGTRRRPDYVPPAVTAVMEASL
jgi:CDP-paratose 2-epimerase